MSQIHAFAEVDLLIDDGNYTDARLLLTRHLEENPSDRSARLYLLLINIKQTGPEPHEQEIERVRTLSELTNAEKDILRQIFVLGFKSAEQAGRQEQALAYQRLLRRLLLNQSLDQAIPRTEHRQVQRPWPESTEGQAVSNGNHNGSFRILRPAMAGASAMPASAIGHAREKIHISRAPWQTTVRAAGSSIGAALKFARDWSTSLYQGLNRVHNRSADVFRRISKHRAFPY